MNRFRNSCVLAAVALLGSGLASMAGSADALKGAFFLKGPDGATWRLKFDGKDTFSVTRDGKLGVEGTYKVVKDLIDFTDESGPFAEKGDAQTGTYKWKVADNKLTFTKVKDTSPGRSGVLTGGAWDMKM